jgi:hypothetical protein
MSQPRHTHRKLSYSSTKPPNLTTLYKIITILFPAIAPISIQALIKLNVNPIFHHINMHTYPLLVVNHCHLICTQNKESTFLDNNFNVFCHFPPTIILIQCFFKLFFTFNKYISLKTSNFVI